MPASASAATSCGWVRRVELHAGPRRGEQVLRHPAVGAVQPGEDALGAVHVLAGAAGAAQPAGRRRVQDHGVADRDVGDRGADLVHPAGVLVADRVGQRRVHRLVPLAQDDVQVGPAHPGAADLHDHVERALDGRLGDLVDGRAARCTRATARPSWDLLHLALAAGCVAVGQHAAAHAAVRLGVDPGQPGPAQVQRQRLRRRPPRPVVASTSSAESSLAGRPSSARRARSRSRSADGGHVAEGHHREVVHASGPRPAVGGRPGPSPRARPCARSRSGARRARRRPGPPKDSANPDRAAIPLLIASEAKWSSSTTSVRRTPRHRRHRVVRVRHHQEGEVGRAEVRRQPQPHLHVTVVGHGARRDEAERGDRLVQLRVAHRVQRGQHLCLICHTSAPCSTSAASSWAAGAPSPGELELRRHLDAVELGRVQARGSSSWCRR